MESLGKRIVYHNMPFLLLIIFAVLDLVITMSLFEYAVTIKSVPNPESFPIDTYRPFVNESVFRMGIYFKSILLYFIAIESGRLIRARAAPGGPAAIAAGGATAPDGND